MNCKNKDVYKILFPNIQKLPLKISKAQNSSAAAWWLSVFCEGMWNTAEEIEDFDLVQSAEAERSTVDPLHIFLRHR